MSSTTSDSASAAPFFCQLSSLYTTAVNRIASSSTLRPVLSISTTFADTTAPSTTESPVSAISTVASPASTTTSPISPTSATISPFSRASATSTAPTSAASPTTSCSLPPTNQLVEKTYAPPSTPPPASSTTRLADRQADRIPTPRLATHISDETQHAVLKLVQEREAALERAVRAEQAVEALVAENDKANETTRQAVDERIATAEFFKCAEMAAIHARDEPLERAEAAERLAATKVETNTKLEQDRDAALDRTKIVERLLAEKAETNFRLLLERDAALERLNRKIWRSPTVDYDNRLPVLEGIMVQSYRTMATLTTERDLARMRATSAERDLANANENLRGPEWRTKGDEAAQRLVVLRLARQRDAALERARNAEQAERLLYWEKQKDDAAARAAAAELEAQTASRVSAVERQRDHALERAQKAEAAEIALNEQQKCAVCFVDDRRWAPKVCGHFIMCDACKIAIVRSSRVIRCPHCRTVIPTADDFIRIFSP